MSELAGASNDELHADAVFRLIYRSKSRIPAASAEAELASIFTVARARNAANGVTGALMMHEGQFAQVLEGPEDAVRKLYDRIKTDPRHGDIETRAEGPVAERAFGRWAMAEVREHGERDVPVLATQGGLAEGAPWKTSKAQDEVLAELRLLTRGYGRGA